MTVILDASALLAVSFNEAGAQAVADVLDDAMISAVNATEVISKYVDRGLAAADAAETFAAFELSVVPFDQEQANAAGALRRETRDCGLSLGDRCCLALARTMGVQVITADRAWEGLDIGVEIRVIR